MTKSIYIHIPFCKKFCAYCDFVKCIYNKDKADKYIDLVIDYLQKNYKNNKFETIYIGGGTPNALDDKQLDRLLSAISKHLSNSYELTIELNPEFVTDSQITILKKNKVNRVSIGIQTLDESILKTTNRANHICMVNSAISLLHKHKINNISCDLIYGFKNQTNKSIKNDIDMLYKYNIKHISMYSLEIKEQTLWGKKGYKVDEYQLEDNLKFAIKYLAQLGFKRYEVSNWAKSNKYQSKHNVSVWKTNDWAAIGLGAHGMENKILYHFEGSLLDWKLINQPLSTYDYYFQVMMMGLRLSDGLDLNNPLHLSSYNYFKHKLDNDKLIIKTKNRVRCKNINLLDNVLVNLEK